VSPGRAAICSCRELTCRQPADGSTACFVMVPYPASPPRTSQGRTRATAAVCRAGRGRPRARLPHSGHRPWRSGMLDRGRRRSTTGACCCDILTRFSFQFTCLRQITRRRFTQKDWLSWATRGGPSGSLWLAVAVCSGHFSRSFRSGTLRVTDPLTLFANERTCAIAQASSSSGVSWPRWVEHGGKAIAETSCFAGDDRATTTTNQGTDTWRKSLRNRARGSPPSYR